MDRKETSGLGLRGLDLRTEGRFFGLEDFISQSQTALEKAVVRDRLPEGTLEGLRRFLKLELRDWEGKGGVDYVPLEISGLHPFACGRLGGIIREGSSKLEEIKVGRVEGSRWKVSVSLAGKELFLQPFSFWEPYRDLRNLDEALAGLAFLSLITERERLLERIAGEERAPFLLLDSRRFGWTDLRSVVVWSGREEKEREVVNWNSVAAFERWFRFDLSGKPVILDLGKGVDRF